MNRFKEIGKKAIMLATSLTAALILGTAVWADDGSLLSVDTVSITSDSWVKCTLKTTELTEAITEDVGGYTITIDIDPMPSQILVEEGVGLINAVNGNYIIASQELNGMEKLHFTLYPDSTLTKETTYSISVTSVGNTSMSEQTDSFTFTATPAESLPGRDGETPKTETDVETGTAFDQEKMQTEDRNHEVVNQESSKTQKSSSSGAGSAVASSDTASVTYEGSWNNYLESLTVNGYEFTQAFNKTRDTYFMTAPETTSYLDVSAEADDSTATVVITGADELVSGRNKVMINVTAENGDVRIYRIYVDVE